MDENAPGPSERQKMIFYLQDLTYEYLMPYCAMVNLHEKGKKTK
jgi:hypothetical protein